MAALVMGIAAVCILSAVVALRLYRRGWRTWGDICSMGAALALLGAVLSGLDEGPEAAVMGGLFWGVGGSWLYWLSRPADPQPAAELEGLTREQERLLRRFRLVLSVAFVVAALVELGLAVLYVMKEFNLPWVLVGLVLIGAPHLILLRIRKALRESGPPFDRAFGRLPRPPPR